MIKIGIVGCGGRMGKLILREILQQPDLTLSGATVKITNSLVGIDCGALLGMPPINIAIHSNNDKLFSESDVVIDFTSPQATVSHASLAEKHQKALVVGTTGLNSAQEDILKQAAKKAPIIYAANTSLGVNLLAALVEQAAKSLSTEFDIEINEMHHRRKMDAPSGTALLLAESAAKGRAADLHKILAAGNRTGERKVGSIGFSVLRGGGVVGDHDVLFASDEEIITLSHRALDRNLFAKGALKAAIWAAKKQQSGLYTMRDVLGL